MYLIIEEINRGNCAQIFGDLFQLLDRGDDGFSEYPVDADSDLADHIRKELADSTRDDFPEGVKEGKKLVLPNNLYIWATMNTSDQSLFPIDSAFKRRWDWEYIPIKPHYEAGYRIKIENTLYDWWDFLEKINKVIDTTTNSEDKKLGYFFVKAYNREVNAKKFVNKVLFYLWNDVFKNYGFDNEIFKKEDGKDNIAFSDFYSQEGEPNIPTIKLFLKNLGVEPIGDAPEEEVVEENEEPREPGRTVAHRLINSVSFPDGTKFDIADGLTHFAVYREAIKKIGVERAEPIAAASIYHRLNRPVISREKFPEIEESNSYSYEQVDGYFLVKGMSDDTYINILNLCNEKLGLGIVVKFRQ